MVLQGEPRSNARQAFLFLQDAVVWGALFALGSVALFVAAVALTLTFQIDLMGVFATGYKYISMWLVRSNLIDPENVPGAILLGHIVPWLVLGVSFGITKRFLRADRPPFRRGMLAASTVVVVVVVASASLVLWW